MDSKGSDMKPGVSLVWLTLATKLLPEPSAVRYNAWRNVSEKQWDR